MFLKNANIITMEQEDYPSGYLRVQEGRITALGRMEDCPEPFTGEAVHDLGGRTVLPGFIDAHSHIGLYASGLGAEGDDINEDTDPTTPHLRTIDGIDPFDRAFRDARAAGVTAAAVSPGSANPVAGQVCAIKTAGRSVEEMLIQAPLAIKFALGENPKMVYGVKPQQPATRMGIASLIREQLTKAQRYLRDAMRAQDDEDFDEPEFDSRCEALIPLLRGEIAAHFHAHKAYDIQTAMRIAGEFGLRYAIVHGTEGHLIADMLAEADVDVICGPLICARTKPELMGLAADNCRKLAEAGVRVAVSTDHPEVPAEFLLMSASVARAGGMRERAALEAVTINAARVLGLDGRIGSLKPGKDADLLVFSGNLLTVGAKPEHVFIAGIEQIH